MFDFPSEGLLHCGGCPSGGGKSIAANPKRTSTVEEVNVQLIKIVARIGLSLNKKRVLTHADPGQTGITGSCAEGMADRRDNDLVIELLVITIREGDLGNIW